MTKHTPGPWWFRLYAMSDADRAFMREKMGREASRLLTNQGGVAIMSGDPDGDCKRIAEVDCQTEFKRGKGHETECAERDANARLIAAAPEMREALEALVRALTGANSPADGENWNALMDLLLGNARAAIAKAESAP